MFTSLGRLLAPGLLAIGLLTLFAPGLFHGQVPAFRDAYHFYYPQAVWLDACAEVGEFFPRWNRSEGLGGSVTGQASSALYYPGRVVWFIPGLDVAQRFSLYCVLHLLLAAGGMAYAARQLTTRLPRSAICLAGVCYSLSCPVFFQHTNLIYLTSAAWLGWAIAITLRLQRRVAFLDTVLFAIVAACMFLGGDPHNCVNAFIVAALCSLCTTLRCVLVATPRASHSAFLIAFSVGIRQFGWIASALGITLACTAIQWIPMQRWAQQSVRMTSSDVPATASLDQTTTKQTIPSPHQSPTHLKAQHHIYDFSLSPWHVATCLFPTAGGHYLPAHSRWWAALPAEGRMWIPSLYFGCLPFLLLLSCLKRHRYVVNLYCVVIALFALVASFGHYSIVWLARDIANGIGATSLASMLPTDPVGGIYWLLAETIPAYEYFRYPAKWTVWFSAGVSLLAAERFGQLITTDGSLNESAESGMALETEWLNSRIVKGCLWCATTGAVLSLGVWSLSRFTSVPFAISGNAWLAAHGGDRWLGSPSLAASAWSCFLASSIPATCLMIVRFGTARLPIGMLVILTTLELLVVNCNWVTFVTPPSATSLDLPASRDSASLFTWVDVSAADIINDRWNQDEGTGIGQHALYQQRFLLGKLASVSSARNLNTIQSLKPAHVQALCSQLARLDDLTADQPKLDARLAALGITHRRIRIPGTLPAEFAWQEIESPQPLCRLQSSTAGGHTAQSLTWQWQRQDQLRIVVDSIAKTELIVLQLNDGGWTATIEGQAPVQVPASQADQPYLRLSIPAGHTKLHLERGLLW